MRANDVRRLVLTVTVFVALVAGACSAPGGEAVQQQRFAPDIPLPQTPDVPVTPTLQAAAAAATPTPTATATSTSTPTPQPTPTATPTPQPTATPTLPPPTPTPQPPTPTPVPPAQDCLASYPDFCIAPGTPDLDCGDIPYRRFRVLPPDPHRFDADHDGIGCESG